MEFRSYSYVKHLGKILQLNHDKRLSKLVYCHLFTATILSKHMLRMLNIKTDESTYMTIKFTSSTFMSFYALTFIFHEVYLK